MTKKTFSDELERALARPDAEKMIQQIDAFADYYANGSGDWPDEYAEDFGEIVSSHFDDPEKSLAYVIIGASRTDDAEFLGFLGCGPLEDILVSPSAELLDRVVSEARKSLRFRWLLSNPFKVAIAPRAWEAIEHFRTTGPHEEPSAETLPPRK
jgi:hypothetical protein